MGHPKKIYIFLYYLLTSGTFLLPIQIFAQRKPLIADKNMGAEATISIPEVVENCTHCQRLISTFLGRTKGVLSYTVDTRSRKIKVFFAPDLTDVVQLRYAIANAGFLADTIKAEPTSVKLLPICCRQPISEEWLNKIKANERERAQARRQRYRPLRNFICCERCDYYYKYAILKDSTLLHFSLKRRK